jgi:hypothetical protein
MQSQPQEAFMNKLYFFVSLIMAVVMFNCTSVTVKTDYDREYDFVKFKTYRWASAEEINPEDILAKNPLILKRVQDAVDRELQAKGLELSDAEDVDLVVVAHAGTKERMQVHNTGGYYRGWYNPYWGPYGGTTTVSYYEEGTLVIDLVSWENKELAWRGMGTSIVKDYDDVDKVTEYINNWVGKIMAQYPPKK